MPALALVCAHVRRDANMKRGEVPAKSRLYSLGARCTARSAVPRLIPSERAILFQDCPEARRRATWARSTRRRGRPSFFPLALAAKCNTTSAKGC